MDAHAVAARAQRMETVAQLSAGLAHDFNNILLALFGLLDEIEGAKVVDTEVLEDLRTAARRTADLTRRIAALGRTTGVHVRPVDAGRLLARAEPLLARLCGAKGVLLKTSCTEGVVCAADPDRLEEILWNLVANARDASRRGQTVRVEAAYNGDAVDVRVCDDGVGIPPHLACRVFEPFVTTKAPGDGSGLGLPMVQTLVRDMHGTVELESDPGKGTVVTVRLPASSRPPAVETPAAGGRARRRALVVDDFLAKPFTRDELAARLRMLVG